MSLNNNFIRLFAGIAFLAFLSCGTNELIYDRTTNQICTVDGSQLMKIKISTGSEFVRLRRIKGVDSHCIYLGSPLSKYAVEYKGEVCCFNKEGEFYMHPDSSYQIENLTVGDAVPLPETIPPRSR